MLIFVVMQVQTLYQTTGAGSMLQVTLLINLCKLVNNYLLM